MKRSIFFLALLLASVSAASAQRAASASMQISATVVESAKLNVVSTASGAQVVSSSISGVMFAVNQQAAAAVVSESSEVRGRRPSLVQTVNVASTDRQVVVSAFYQ